MHIYFQMKFQVVVNVSLHKCHPATTHTVQCGYRDREVMLVIRSYMFPLQLVGSVIKYSITMYQELWLSVRDVWCISLHLFACDPLILYPESVCVCKHTSQ